MRTRLTERNLSRIVRRVINEQNENDSLNVQKALNKVWTNVKIKEDGVMGPETIKYIKLFQKQNGLDVTGIVDDKLKTKLFRLLQDDTSSNDGKNGLIDSLMKSLNSMKNSDSYDALTVAQIIYNNCAQWMNKNAYFSSRPGNPTKTKAQFAPEE